MTSEHENHGSVLMQVESSPEKTLTAFNVTSADKVATTETASVVNATPVSKDQARTNDKIDIIPDSNQTPKESKTSPKPKSGTKGKKNYITMIHEVIVEIGDRTGSSVPAIMKVMKARYPLLVHKPTFKNAFNMAIKMGLKEKRLVKVRASYKINSEWTKKEKAKARAKEVKKKNEEKRRRNQMAKRKEEKAKQQEQDTKKETVSPIRIETVMSEEQVCIGFAIFTTFEHGHDLLKVSTHQMQPKEDC